MKIQLSTRQLGDIQSGCIAFAVFETEREKTGDSLADQFLLENPKFGKLFDTQLLFTNQRRILLIGLGKRDSLDFEKLQNFAGAATFTLSKKAKEIFLFVPKTDRLNAEEAGEAIAIGGEIALYDPTKLYKKEREDIILSALEVVVEKAEKGFQEGIKRGIEVANAINLVRGLGDMPPNEMTPSFFLSEAKKLARDQKLTITVLDERRAKLKGMGAFAGVAQGSGEPSYMIAMEYKGNIKSKDKWGLVGKGITFDSGGISIKPSSQMHEMKYDMCGAATVLSAVTLASKLKLRVNIVGVMAVTENLPGGRAQRPGDIVKTYSGKRVEVLNTDAEGRLVLSDALTFAQKDFKATKIIDLATLTGAIIVSLGGIRTGIFSNNAKFAQDVLVAGAKSGERMWEMPMDEDYNEMIKSDISDIANVGHGGPIPGAAGSITGAKFLEAFIEKDKPWVHLDIAGTAWDMKPKPFRGIGATGVGVKTLIKLISGT